MANGNFGGGDGTKKNPFLVEDALDFDAVRNEPTKHYKQTKDIDLSVFENFKPICDAGWIIEPFYGAYDGDNKKIKNARIISGDMSSADYNGQSGLFGVVANATLKNIIIENIYVIGEMYVGALAGAIHNTYYRDDEPVLTTIENCHVISGTIIGGGYRNDGVTPWDGGATGGLIGSIDTARTTVVEIKKCSAKCNVFGGAGNGGFVGMIDLDESAIVKITDCFTQCVVGPFATAFWDMGGFAGEVSANHNSIIEIKNCYSASVFTDTTENPDDAFGFFGDPYIYYRVDATAAIISESNYYDSELCGLTDNEWSQPRTTAEMKRQETFADWDFSAIWDIEEGVDYPFFNAEQPTVEIKQPRTKCKSLNLSKRLLL